MDEQSRKLASTSFKIEFDGPAVDGGAMMVRDFAPSLLALSDLVTEAGRELSPTKASVRLEIVATRDGSFVVDLLMVGLDTDWDQFVSVLGSDQVSAIVNLQELLIGGGYVAKKAGVFEAIRNMRGRKVKSEKPAREPGFVIVEMDDGEELEYRQEVIRLTKSTKIRKKAKVVVEPLSKDGIEAFRARSGSKVTTTVSKSDIESFTVPDEPDDEEHSEIRMFLTIESVEFRPGRKWRFSDGDTYFNAAIEDQEFLSRIDQRHDLFGKGDSLRCLVRIDQTKKSKGVRTEWTIVEVLDHLDKPDQLGLPEPE